VIIRTGIRVIWLNLTNYFKSFVQVANKWKEIEGKCCKAKCINTEKPIGTCITGNGFVNLINDENIEYIECVKEDNSCYGKYSGFSGQ